MHALISTWFMSLEDDENKIKRWGSDYICSAFTIFFRKYHQRCLQGSSNNLDKTDFLIHGRLLVGRNSAKFYLHYPLWKACHKASLINAELTISSKAWCANTSWPKYAVRSFHWLLSTLLMRKGQQLIKEIKNDHELILISNFQGK